MSSRTVLSDFRRTIRDEPLFYIFKHRIWLTHDRVPLDSVLKWLRMRYVETKTGHRYKVRTYKHSDGNHYVDSILFETLNDTDIAFIKIMWGWSEAKIRRSAKAKGRKRLTPEQRAALNQRIAAVVNEFYDTV